MVLIKSLFFAALTATAAAKSAVIDLVPSNFDDIVLKSGKPTLVEFFAPWCGHCKTLAPVYEELAGVFATSKDKIQIAKVDADAERELGKRFGVQGFPTLKFFDGKSDKPIEYDSARDLASLTDFIIDKTGVKPKKKLEMPSQVEMLTDKTFKETVGSDKHVLVAFTAPWCGHCKTLAPVWEGLAEVFANEDNVVIAKVDAEAPDSKATAEEQGVKSYPTIKWFPAGSKEPTAYSGARAEKDFIDWINEKAGTQRAEGGGLNNVAGTIASLGAVASKYIDGTAAADLVADIKAAAGDVKDASQTKYAEYYVRVFDKLSKNDGYVAKEAARLESILKKGGLAPTKSDELQAKLNILAQFIKAKTQEVKDEL